jgi:hypothetical protein
MLFNVIKYSHESVVNKFWQSYHIFAHLKQKSYINPQKTHHLISIDVNVQV